MAHFFDPYNNITLLYHRKARTKTGTCGFLLGSAQDLAEGAISWVPYINIGREKTNWAKSEESGLVFSHFGMQFIA